MKLILVTQEDPFYLPIFFREFMPRAIGLAGVTIAGVVVQKPLGKKSQRALARQMFEFYGWAHFLRQSTVYAWRKLSKQMHELGLWPRSFSIEYYVRRAGVELLGLTNVNSPAFVEFVRGHEIDLIVSVAGSQIFKKELLAAPRLGCINIHNASLPDYRGMLPNFWQMYHGERHSVMTIHEMDEELDRGRIVLQQETEIVSGMTLDALIRETKRTNAVALIRALELYRDGVVELRPLPAREGSYFTFPNRADVEEFKKRGYRIL